MYTYFFHVFENQVLFFLAAILSFNLFRLTGCVKATRCAVKIELLKLKINDTKHTTEKNGSILYPKLSTPTRIAASNVLDPLQNTEANPSAAPNIGSNPNTGPSTYPRQEPMENSGATSPPMNPEERVRIVSAIFKIQS